MILLYGIIMLMWTFTGVSWEEASTAVELSTTAIFIVFAGYFFGNFRDKASIIIQRYAVHRQLFRDSKMHDVE